MGLLRNLEPVIEVLILVIRVCYHIIVSSVKALLPSSVLPHKSVEDEVVLITGSGSGLGRLMALRFAKMGAKIVLWDNNQYSNNETLEQIKATTGSKAFAYTVDLKERVEIYETAALVKKEVGDVNILINNAGIVSGKKIFDCPDELMEKTMAVNTNSLFWTAKAFVPKMLENNHGHIVTIASMAGHVGVSGLVDYCASKHGAVGFSDALSAEIRAQGRNVNVTVVNPYYIDTGMFHGVKTFSYFFPILEAEFVVDRIMEAILTNVEALYLPTISNFHIALKGLLPREACALVGDYFSLNKTMNDFVGRGEQINNNH